MPKERIYGSPRGTVGDEEQCDLLVQWDKAAEWMERGDNLGGAGVVSLAMVPPTEDAPDGVRAYAYLDRVAITVSLTGCAVLAMRRSAGMRSSPAWGARVRYAHADDLTGRI